MSICEEIKWHDNTGYYVKGKKVPKTVYGEVKSLERQLEEAREEVEYALNFFNKNKQFGVVGILKEIKNKLKEKGE